MTADLFKILAVCLIAAIICIILKPKPEYSIFLALSAVVCIAVLIMENIALPISQIIGKLSEYSINTEYFKVALKSVGIGYVTAFAADACRDSGQTMLANCAELAGKCAIFILSLPLVFSLLETAIGFVK